MTGVYAVCGSLLLIGIVSVMSIPAFWANSPSTEVECRVALESLLTMSGPLSFGPYFFT